MHYLRRLGTEYQLRGGAGVLRLLASRVARRRSDLLFERDTHPAEDPAGSLPAVVIDRNNVDDPAVAGILRQVFVGDNEQYRPGLWREDILLVALDERGQVASYAFVLFRTQYKRVLGIPPDMPLIANCFTLAAHRGRRLYPRLLLRTCAELARRGHAKAAISCEPQNQASIRGIERAGFTGIARIRAVIVLLRIVLLRRTESYRDWVSRSAARG